MVKSNMRIEEGRARLTVRLYATETRILQEIERQGQKPSTLIREVLTHYLHDHYQPIYESIYAENRRRNEELLKSAPNTGIPNPVYPECTHGNTPRKK